jgi:porin
VAARRLNLGRGEAGKVARLKRIAAALLLSAAPACSRALAQDSLAQDSLAQDSLAQDWRGFEDRLVKAGVTPSLLYDGDLAADLAGGEKRGATNPGSVHVLIGLDGGRLADLPGLSGWLDALWIYGDEPSAFAGDAQGVSNIAGPPGFRLYEAWLQFNTPENRYSFLAGRYDMNTEFYHLRSASLFLNSSFGIGAEFGLSGIAGPSVFPDTSLGVRFAYKPAPHAVLRVAVLDGVPVSPAPGYPGVFRQSDGLLLVAEAALATHSPTNEPPFSSRFRVGRNADLAPYDDKIAAGAWYYTGHFDDLSATTSSGAPVRRNGEGGAYLLLDHLFFQAPNDPNWRLTGFLQLGIANQNVDRFRGFVGAGLNQTSLLPGRTGDELGLAVAMARNGSHYIESQLNTGMPVSAAETAIELTYLAQVTSWLAMQPNVQYVINPNTDPRLRNAVVAQLRFEVRF